MNLRQEMEYALRTLVDISQDAAVSPEDRISACEAIISTYYEERESVSKYGDTSTRPPQTLSSGNSTMRGRS